MSEIMELRRLSNTAVGEDEHNKFHQPFVKDIVGESYYDHPHSVFVEPVFRKLGNANDVSNDVAGVILAVVAWDRYVANLLPTGVDGIYAVLSNNCDQDHTYIINGPMVRMPLVLINVDKSVSLRTLNFYFNELIFRQRMSALAICMRLNSTTLE